MKLRFLAIVFFAGCGIDNALVGGRCADGYSSHDGACVADPPLEVHLIDPGNAPPPPSQDGSVEITGQVDGGKTEDSGTTVVSSVDASLSDASIVDAASVDGSVVDASVADAQPLVCDPGLVACHGFCIPVADDGHNCGACGKICPSNICIDGECVGATPGDIVLVGHDFTNAWNGSAQAKVLTNAVSIPTTDPIRILSYEDDADAAAVAQARYLVEVGIRRAVAITRATADDLASPSLAQFYDVVLLHDGSSNDPTALGLSWNASLGTFAQKGGVVVALDGAASRMPELLTAAGLLQVGSHTVLPPDTHLIVAAPTDLVGAMVLSPYAVLGNAVSFGGVPVSADTTNVVTADDVPVVIHRFVR